MTLAALRVVVTRPAAQAGALCAALEAGGAEAVRLPLFAIEPAGDEAGASATLAAHHDDDGWIFTSANAARRAAELDRGAWPRLYAIGEATARALADAQHPGALVAPAPASSESLLTLPTLQQVQNRHFLIVTGENGRELLSSELQARGAAVDVLAVYRRRGVEHAAERVVAELEQADAIVLTSGEALERLWELTPADSRRLLLALQLVVPSRRVAEQAEALGFTAPLVPETMSDEAIVAALAQWRASVALQPGMTPDLIVPLAAARSARASAKAARAEAKAEARAARQVARPTLPAAGRDAHPSGSGGIVAWLLVLVLAAALTYGGWMFWDLRQQQLGLQQGQEQALNLISRQVQQLESDQSQTATRQTDLARMLQRAGSDLTAAQGRLDNSEQLMGRVTEELQGGRTRFALASIEQLLLLANDRLLLQHDVRAALLALQIADERLGTLNDPRLFRVRQAIAGERAQLQALPQPDLTAASLTLSSLIDRAPSLPLRARVEARQFGGDDARGAARAAARDPALAATPWYERSWAAIKAGLGALFTVRRDDHASALRLLPAEDEAVLVHVLILKLESARVALLRGEGGAFRESLGSAHAWIDRFFRDGDPAVEGARGEIERLQALELSAPLPDTSGSLSLLRQVLAAPPQP